MKINKTHKLSQHKRTKRSKTKRIKRSKTKRVKHSKLKPSRKSRKQRGGEEEYGFDDDLDVDQYIKENPTIPEEGFGFGEDLDTVIEQPQIEVSPEEAAAFNNMRGRRKPQNASLKAIRPIIQACPESGACLVLGSFSHQIKMYFGGFTEFENVVPPIVRIGAESVNGFVNQIEYNKRGYSSYAVLKSSRKPSSDNLFYEYVVGQYINKLNKHYPCFLETYGYFMYNPEGNYMGPAEELLETEEGSEDSSYGGKRFKGGANVLKNKYSDILRGGKRIEDTSVLSDGLILLSESSTAIYEDENYVNACKNSQNLAILIQYLKDVKTLSSFQYDRDFMQNDLLFILFQVYMPLGKLKDNFTHYDLHHNNVLIYEPAENKYIEYHYHLYSDMEIVFNSSYMAKLIDYGRCFFKEDNTNNTSIEFNNRLCRIKECNQISTTGHCGEKIGFVHANNPGNAMYMPGTNSRVADIKKDMWLFNIIKTQYSLCPDSIKGLFSNNVHDMARDLTLEIKFLLNNNQKRDNYNARYANKEKFGDLHIYMDGNEPMKFVAYEAPFVKMHKE